MTDLELAERAARLAGEVLLERWRSPAQGVEAKSSATDLVSDADRAAEAAILELLVVERPSDGVLGEEGSEVEGQASRQWLVDPLDGTTNYLYGYPAWSVSVALRDELGAAVGVVHDPSREETFVAVREQGSRLNGARLRVRQDEALATALVATGFGYMPEARAAQAETVARVLPKVRDIRRGGSAALDLAGLAAGRLDGYYERGLQPWDWAAGRLLVVEAGGAVEELRGEPPGLVAGARGLVEQLAELVA